MPTVEVMLSVSRGKSNREEFMESTYWGETKGREERDKRGKKKDGREGGCFQVEVALIN